jgi:hypothetical protein
MAGSLGSERRRGNRGAGWRDEGDEAAVEAEDLSSTAIDVVGTSQRERTTTWNRPRAAPRTRTSRYEAPDEPQRRADRRRRMRRSRRPKVARPAVRWPTNAMRTGKLVLWFSVLTLAISIARFWLEYQQRATTQSGGGLFWLGISWLPPVLGLLLGWQLAREGSRPRVRRAPLWLLGLLAVLIGTVALAIGTLSRTDQTEAAYELLRHRVLLGVAVAVALAVVAFALWPRAARLLLWYAIPARATVIALTLLAHWQGWDTHYQKFGPSGITRGTLDTVVSAIVAQVGCWVPFTIVTGCLGAACAAALTRSPSAERS